MKKYILPMLALLLALAGCGRESAASNRYEKHDRLINPAKPIAYGEDYEVHIFADGANLDAVKRPLESSLGREVTVVVEEKYFSVNFQEAKALSDFKPYKNLIFCGTLAGKDPVSLHITKTLAPKLVSAAEASGAELFVISNHYSRDQLILYLLAKDPSTLAKLAEDRSDQIFGYLLERFRRRLAMAAYQNPVIGEEFFANRPFTIKIPNIYRLWKDEKSGRFLSFVFQPTKPSRTKPDKYISVYYEPMPVNQVTPEWIYKTRQELGQKFMQGDYILNNKYRTEPDSIAGFKGLRMMGHWGNKEGGGFGGGFQTWAFWHAPTKTAWLVDNIVFFPDGWKLPTLLELGMISQSLEIK